jgi:hypothetical protein
MSCCRARKDGLKRITWTESKSCHYCEEDCCDNDAREVDCGLERFHTSCLLSMVMVMRR